MSTAAGRSTPVRRIAQTLWIAWSLAIWHVVFDSIVVAAGREYLAAAIPAALAAGPYPRMDDWMVPAVTRGLWVATASSAAILFVGFAAIRRVTILNEGPAKAGPHGQGVQREGTP